MVVVSSSGVSPACRSASSADDFVSWFMYHKRRYTGSLERRAHSSYTGECARYLSRVVLCRLWYRALRAMRADGPDAKDFHHQ